MLKYILQERAAHDDDRARELFRRWLAMKPDVFAWRWQSNLRDRGNTDVRELLAQFVVEQSAGLMGVLRDVRAAAATGPRPRVQVAQTACECWAQVLRQRRMHLWWSRIHPHR